PLGGRALELRACPVAPMPRMRDDDPIGDNSPDRRRPRAVSVGGATGAGDGRVRGGRRGGRRRGRSGARERPASWHRPPRRRSSRPERLRRRRPARGRAVHRRARLQPRPGGLRPAAAPESRRRIRQQGSPLRPPAARAPEASAMRPLFLALVPAGAALTVLAYEVEADSLHTQDGRLVVQLAAAAAFLVAGLLAWWRRPTNRLGPLMVAAGFALLMRHLRYSHDALAFTLFFVFGDLGFALVVHSSLAYPAGRTKDRVERWQVRAGYATALTLPIAILMLHDVRAPLVQYGSLHRKSDLLVSREAHAVELLQKSFVVALYGVLATLFVVLVWRRLHSAPTGSRRILSPLLVAAAA